MKPALALAGCLALAATDSLAAEPNPADAQQALLAGVIAGRTCKSLNRQAPKTGTDLLFTSCAYSYKGARWSLVLESSESSASFTALSLPPTPKGMYHSGITLGFTPADPCFLEVVEHLGGRVLMVYMVYVDSRTGQVYTYANRPSCSR